MHLALRLDFTFNPYPGKSIGHIRRSGHESKKSNYGIFFVENAFANSEKIKQSSRPELPR